MPEKETRQVLASTPWEFASQALRVFGGLAPYVMIAAGLAFAYYKFQELSLQYQQSLTESQQAAEEQFREDLQDARDALVNTYKATGELSRQQIDNVSALLKQQDDVADRLSSKQTTLDALEDQVRGNEKLAAQAQRDVEDAEALKRRVEGELFALTKEVTDNQARLAQFQDELNSKTAGLRDRAANIETLREQLDRLASAVISDQEAGTLSESSAQMARTIKAEVLENPKALLRAYAETPTEVAGAALTRLVGMQAGNLKQLLQEGLGYSFWATGESIADEGENLVLGAARQTDATYEGVVAITVEDERVVDVEPLSILVAVRVPDLSDWNRFIAIMSTPADDIDEELDIPESQADWSLTADFLETRFRFESLFGEDRRTPLLSMEKFRERFPEKYRLWTEGEGKDYPPYANIAMTTRAAAFRAAELDGINRPMPDALRDAVIGLLDASVARDLGRAQRLVDPSLGQEVTGRVAAAALRSGFRIASVEPLRNEVRQQTQQQVASQADGTALAQQAAPPAETLRVVGEYGGPTGGVPGRVEFYFRRPEAGPGWVLIGFEDVTSASKG